ncbi:MAG TPA: ABC transporter permease, partial [Planctomycetaceae bacterium]|nr:ABC transporter permease [Planctomycetaceae bacterium]
MLRKHVIEAVFKRNLMAYFSGVLGYLFIVVFVVAGAAFAFSPEFFANNLANLDQLSRYYPLLLLFIVPAITMGVWAEEKKLGTDELLFTLPATDVEILLGKYLAVVCVYTVALLFSLTQLGVLAYYADPDWGLLICTYFGYWIAGASLLSAGMFASALTNSNTVAFVLGVAICAVPVFIDRLAPGNQFLQELSLSEQLREFTMGVIPLSGILYFVSFAVFMLYLNAVVIGRRHWSSGREGALMELQFGIRAICLAATLVSLNVVVGRGSEVIGLRFDMTAEKIFTLSSTTRELIKKIDKDHPVLIQAFISRRVPREFVFKKRQLRGLLRQYDRLGGNRIAVRFVDVEPYSEEAEEAESYGIEPLRVQTEREGRFEEVDIYLGAVVSSPYDEVVIPVFEEGTPIEYELTRSIRTVSQEERLTVGILRTDALVTGGFRMAAFRSVPEWRISRELKKQYRVEEVSPDSEIDREKYDVLMAVLPSSLTQKQMEHFVDYVQSGKPVLIFDDPYTWYDQGMSSPRQPKPRPGGMFGGAPPEQKADG